MPIHPSIQKSLDATKVSYVNLGSSGLKVSVPILGAMGLGSSSWIPYVLDEDQSLPLLKAAFDAGLNTWDTANMYSNGVSEEVIGKAIKEYGIPREKLVLMTKGGLYVPKEPGAFALDGTIGETKDYVNLGGA